MGQMLGCQPRLRQEICELEVSLGYTVNPGQAWALAKSFYFKETTPQNKRFAIEGQIYALGSLMISPF